jgi:hypothetical protein
VLLVDFMGTMTNLVEMLEKQKWLVYFLLFWAGVFFFWALQRMAANGFDATEAEDFFYLIANLFDLAAGIMLGLFSLKLLKINFIGAISRERLLVFFLLLWAGSFFFWGIGDIIYYGPYAGRYLEDALGVIGGLLELGAGAVLGLFGLKLFGSKDPSTVASTGQ